MPPADAGGVTAPPTRPAVARTDHAGYVTLTIDRPDRRNALDPAAASELAAAISAAGAEPAVHAIVLTGRAPAFCAGADLAMLTELVGLAPEEIANRIYGVFQGLVKTVMYCDVPVVAAVNGPALGAGCDLALACDCRIVTPEASFEETWVKLGLIPGMGGLALLPPLVGLGRARSMLYRGERIDGVRAAEIGLAEAVTGDADLAGFVDSWLSPLVRTEREALTAIKRGTRRTALRLIEDDLEYASSRQALRFKSEAVADRIAALTSRIQTEL